ncbi:MAG: glucarate transporter [Bryobacteraceae bacterium]|nr:MAG: glucarate transporter [Bryobacteraceae bacterium]
MTAPQVPTRARHWVVVFAVTLAILAYIDRVAISQAAPLISHDLGFSKQQMGYIFSAFALAYALFEIPGGWMGDWLGPRRVLMRIVLWWSFFTAATGWAWNFVSMWIVRFLFGAGEAGCFPNLTKAFTTWLPQHERVRAQGIMWSFARWGGAFTPPLFALLFRFMGWRDVFHVFGLLGLVWAIFFYRWYRDNPKDHPSVNAAELALLEGAEKTASGHGDVPWGRMVRRGTVWLLWAQYFLLTYPWYFYITWLPTYLQEARHMDMERSAHYAILPLLFGGIGSMFAGFIAKYVALWLGSVNRARKVMGATGFVGASLFLLIATVTKDPLPAMLAMGLASFCNDLVMPGAWGACMDIGGKYAGTLAGSMNMMGNLAGILAPSIGGFILAHTNNNWSLFLFTMAGAYFLGAFCWPFIDSTRPLED